MAYEIANQAVLITMVAAADLSAKQYYFVKVSGTGVDVCSGATDVPLGVLQNNPVSGAEASVLVVGGTKIVSGASIAAGIKIGTGAAGKADAKVAGTDTTEYTVGQVILAATADAEILTAIINCASPTRSA